DPRPQHQLGPGRVEPVDPDPVVVREAVVEQLHRSLGSGLGAGRLGARGADQVEGVAVLDGPLLGNGVAHWLGAQRSAQRSIPTIAFRRSDPLVVREYSTQGGTSETMVRST